jgi:hypothetical protein
MNRKLPADSLFFLVDDARCYNGQVLGVISPPASTKQQNQFDYRTSKVLIEKEDLEQRTSNCEKLTWCCDHCDRMT